MTSTIAPRALLPRDERVDRVGCQGTVRIGISGWRYAPWRNVFYPPGLAQRRELSFAAAKFATIELNGSFYSLQHPQSYAQWYDETPDGFVFAVKGSRYITHMLKLQRVEVALANFFASGVLRLYDKLGPFLWQFPPHLAFDERRFADFFARLPRNSVEAAALGSLHDGRVDGRAFLDIDRNRPLQHAVEIRHPSFACPAFIALLRRHGVGLVIADTAGRWPLLEDITADFVYIRLHGHKELYASGYDAEALQHWAARIDSWRRGEQVADAQLAAPETAMADRAPRPVFCYFDNDIKVHAPFDALQLCRQVDAVQATNVQ